MGHLSGFLPRGREFEQANLEKFKCPGACPGGYVEASSYCYKTKL